MEPWENPKARVDLLALTASRAEVEGGNTSLAAAMLSKLLKPENAKRLAGRVIFGIRGYDDDPRALYEVADQKVPGGKAIGAPEIQRFMLAQFIAMNNLSKVLGETQEANDRRSREIATYFSMHT